MKRWKLIYELRILFSEPVFDRFYSLRCFPKNRSMQEVCSCAYKIVPCSGSECQGRDSFGNQILYGRMEEAGREFGITMTAVAAVREGPEPEPSSYYRLGMYRYQTPYTSPGQSIREFLKMHQKPGHETAKSPEAPFPAGFLNRRTEPGAIWKRTEVLMDEVWNKFSYQSGSTNAGTTAEEAFAQRQGVCQDYAQILLSILREEGITARYVAGAVPGEGETHAWVEVWQDGYWKGFDPTNNRATDASYLVFAVGRDAWDCALNRGIFRGNAGQEKRIYVKMEETEHG